MNFGQAIAAGFRNYFNFSTRASRSEFWYWALFSTLVSVIAALLDLALFANLDAENLSPISSVANLALLIPGISVNVRRLHDIDRTGWWLLLLLTIIGGLWLIYWDCVKGTDGPNRFGPDPLAVV